MKNANHTVGTHRSMLKPSPPWLHCYGTPPRTGNDMPNVSAELSNFKSNALLLERYFPKLAVYNGRGSHSTDRMCLSMLHPMNTQSCGRETPCGKSPCHTRVGPQSRFSAELRTTLTIFPFFAEVCTPAPPPYLVNQARSWVHCRSCSWVRCGVYFGSRTRLRSRVCSRVVGENINASAQQWI